MKKTVFIFIILFHTNLFSQIIYNDTSFKKKIFNLKIVKKDAVSDESFGKGKFIFGEATKSGLKSVGDYRNLAVALSHLGEDKKLIKYSIDKAFSLNSEMMFSFYEHLKKTDSIQYKKELKSFPSIKDKLLKLEEYTQTKVSKGSTFNSYCKKNNLNINLVKLLRLIEENDQKYRTQDYMKNLAKQKELDSSHLSIIDSLYKKHGTYIGKSLVGDKFSHVMWLVIQHSNIKKMEEYLPIILVAVKNKELNKTPLKMLIDRIYTIKYGYQIFGSQMGIEISDDEIRNKVITKYALDSLK